MHRQGYAPPSVIPAPSGRPPECPGLREAEGGAFFCRSAVEKRYLASLISWSPGFNPRLRHCGLGCTLSRERETDHG